MHVIKWDTTFTWLRPFPLAFQVLELNVSWSVDVQWLALHTTHTNVAASSALLHLRILCLWRAKLGCVAGNDKWIIWYWNINTAPEVIRSRWIYSGRLLLNIILRSCFTIYPTKLYASNTNKDLEVCVFKYITHETILNTRIMMVFQVYTGKGKIKEV